MTPEHDRKQTEKMFKELTDPEEIGKNRRKQEEKERMKQKIEDTGLQVI